MNTEPGPGAGWTVCAAGLDWCWRKMDLDSNGCFRSLTHITISIKTVNPTLFLTISKKIS